MNTTPDELKTYLDAALHASAQAAEVIESWRKKFKVKEKARADLVTDADHASQKVIKDYLQSRFPEHLFLGEEDSAGKSIDQLRLAPNSPPVWVVDPVDGTSNYVHDVPAYCISIGLWWQGRAIVGVVHDPRMKEVFSGAIGMGAFLNGERIHVSGTERLEYTLLGTGFPSEVERHMRNLETWRKLVPLTQSLRRTGSTSLNLAYVACGRYDGYWAYDNWPWDMAAGACLIQEAGGQLSATDGTLFDLFRKDIIATNGKFHQELVDAIS